MNRMKRICVALKEDHIYYDVAFFYCGHNYNITEEDKKRIKCYINNDKYHFYDQTETDSYAYEVWKRFFE
jgi:hypothetical protein